MTGSVETRGQSLHRVLLRNLASNYVRYTVLVASSFIITPLLLHHLGERYFAIYAFTLVFVSMLEAFDIGIGGAVVRFVADALARNDDPLVRQTVSAAFYTVGGIGLLLTFAVMFLAGTIAGFFFAPQDAALAATALRLASLAIALQMAATVLYSCLLGDQQFHVGNGVEVAVLLVRLGLQLWLIFAGAGLVPLILALTATMVLRLLVMLLATGAAAPLLLPRPADFRSSRLAALSAFSALAFLEGNMRQAFQQADMFIATRFLVLPEVALLGVVRRLPALIGQVGDQATSAAYPLVASREAQNRLDVRGRFLVVTSRNWLFVAFSCCAGLYIWGDVLLRLWIGPEMERGAAVLRVLLLFAVASSLLDVPLTMLYGIGRLRVCAAIMPVSLLLGVAAGVVGVSKGGLIGLAWGIGGVQALATLSVFAYALHLADVTPARMIHGAVVPVIPPVVVLVAWLVLTYRFVPHTWIGLIATCGAGAAAAIATYLISLKVRSAPGRAWGIRTVLLEE